MPSWIVADPTSDPIDVIFTGFNSDIEAVNWVAYELEITTNQDRIDLLKRCIVAPIALEENAV